MKSALLKAVKAGTSLVSLAAPFLAMAQAPVIAPSAAPNNVRSIGGFAGLLCVIIVNWLFTFLIILAIIFVLFAAYKYLTAGGDPEKVKGANHTLIYAAVAVAVAVVARSVPLIVGSLIVGSANFTC